MKKIYSILTILFAAFAVSACLNHEDNTGFTPETPKISFSESSINVAKEASEITITINSNLPWRIKSNATWVKFDETRGMESGQIKATIARNRLREERVAELTAWITEQGKATMSITQAAAEASEPITFHVKVDGNGLSDGASWEEATTLPTALDAAGDGDRILLAAGTYTPVALIPGGEAEEEKTFEIHSNFTIEGGYPADAVTGAVADPANETILSGNLGSTQAYHVVVVSAVKSDDCKAVLKNLTIKDGKGYSTNKEIYRYAGESTFDAGEGAGMTIGVSNLEMINCRIVDNSAYMAAGCTIAYGGNVVFRNCTVNNNVVSGNGAGVWNQGEITMYDCTISNNRADLACAGYYGVGGKSRIYNTAFIGNDNEKGGKLGGGAYLREGKEPARSSDAIFVNCTFAENKSGSGGAVAVYGTTSPASAAHATFISCTIKGNTASKGGGIWMNNQTCTATLHNCIISGNSTDIEYGGTAVASESQVTKGIGIYGSALLNAEGTTVGGWSFDAATMLDKLDYWNNSLTKSFALVAGATNPAVDQGMSTSELSSLATDLKLDSDLTSKDQNGQERTKKSIGSYAFNN